MCVKTGIRTLRRLLDAMLESIHTHVWTHTWKKIHIHIQHMNMYKGTHIYAQAHAHAHFSRLPACIHILICVKTYEDSMHTDMDMHTQRALNAYACVEARIHTPHAHYDAILKDTYSTCMIAHTCKNMHTSTHTIYMYIYIYIYIYT
jgi:hypothetical protein